jgi:hypothetical protein
VSKKPTIESVRAGPSQATPSKMAPPLSKPGPARKISIVMITHPKAEPGLRGKSEIQLALTKSIRVSQKFCLLDVAALSHKLHIAGIATIRGARVPTFDNLGDDSLPDVHKTPSPEKVGEKCASLLPSTSG